MGHRLPASLSAGGPRKMNCSSGFLWQLSDHQARKSGVGAGRRDTARPRNQEGAGAGVEVRGTYCHTRVLQLGYMSPKHGSQKPLNEPFVRLLHSAEFQDGAFTGLRGLSQVSFQVNLTGCCDSEPALPLRNECLQF